VPKRRKQLDLSIFQRLMIAFVAVVIIPLTVSFYNAQNTTNDLVAAQITSETMSSLDLVANSINGLLNKMYSLAYYVNEDDNIRELMMQEDEDSKNESGQSEAVLVSRKLDRIKKFESIMNNIAFNMMDAKSYVTFLTEAGGRYTNWTYEGHLSELYLARAGAAKPTGEIWLGVEKNYVSGESKAYPYVITLGKNIIYPQDKKMYGTFFISVTEDAVSSLLSADDKRQTRVVLNAGMEIISSTRKEWLGQSFGSLYEVSFPAEPTGSFMFTDGQGQRFMLSYHTLRDWKIVDIKSYDVITRQMNTTRNRLLQLNAFFMLVFLLLSALIARGISKPLLRLTRSMLATDLENTGAPNTDKRHDEVGILEKSFQVMKENIRDLMQHNIDVERKKREAELKSLQAQISPHFLFNTLNTIRWAAINNNTQKVADMVLALSNLLRMTIVKGDELITVAEEIENLKNYVTIFQMRHSIAFDFICRVDEAALKYKIPKLLLQPLVENAIIHGLEEVAAGGMIELSSAVQDEFLILYIRDNGVGMDTDWAADGKEARELKFSGIGAKNVDERIKLYYGEKYGLKVNSGIGRGTVVEVRLPNRLPNQTEEVQ